MGNRIDKVKLIEYFKDNLKDSEIAKLLNCTKDGIYAARMRMNLNRDFKFSEAKNVDITKEQEEILIGHLFGDGNISKEHINARVSIEQGEHQKDYAYWKYNKFINLTNKFNENLRSKIDLRNNKYYISYGCRLRSNPAFNKYYDMFYKSNIKVISKEALELYTNLSLAVHFMDDGYKIGNSYGIATNCFSIEEINTFREFLWNKFKLNTSIHSGNRLYIKTGSKRLFEEIVKPFIIESMKYKLHVS